MMMIFVQNGNPTKQGLKQVANQKDSSGFVFCWAMWLRVRVVLCNLRDGVVGGCRMFCGKCWVLW